MKEAEFWAKMRENLPLDAMMRVENKLDPGMPDVFFMHNNNAGWIELKSELKMPSKINYQPAQPLWLDSYWKKGGTCYTFLNIIDRKEIFIWDGNCAMDLNKIGGTTMIEPMLSVKENVTGWREIYNEIFI